MHSPNTPRRQFLQAGAVTAASLALPALAQSFPAKPIKLICPWPAGGSSDMVMRALAESASKAIGGQVVIENKAGASGMLGPNELVKATPDGYTLSQVTIGVARLPHMQKMQFDPLKDFTYIVCLTGYTFGMVVRADSPIKTWAQFVAFAVKHDGEPAQGGVFQVATHKLAGSLTIIAGEGPADGLVVRAAVAGDLGCGEQLVAELGENAAPLARADGGEDAVAGVVGGGLVGLVEADPDEGVGLGGELSRLGDLDVPDLAAVSVGGGRDHLAHGGASAGQR